MDMVLLAITIGALGLAIGLAVVGWRLLRHDQGQMSARVEALRSLAAEPEPEIADTKTSAPEMPVVVPVFARRATRSSEDPENPENDEPSDWDATLGQTLHVADEREAPMFGTTTSAPMPNRRFLLVTTVAVVMLASAGTVYAVYRPQPSATHPNLDGRFVPPGTVPLQLLSLTESTDSDGTFTVTGLVGNPAAGHTAQNVCAVVYLFDRDGRYFASGRAGIDLPSLAPGDQSPFVVKVPNGSAATRYRVGFRQLDGTVVAHVDKRGQTIDGTTEGRAAPRGTGH
jgi:hypothetical protein